MTIRRIILVLSILFILGLLVFIYIYYKRKLKENSLQEDIVKNIQLAAQNESSLEIIRLTNTLSGQSETIRELRMKVEEIATTTSTSRVKRFVRINLAENQTEVALSGDVSKIVDIERNGVSMDVQLEYSIINNFIRLNIPADNGEFLTIEYDT